MPKDTTDQMFLELIEQVAATFRLDSRDRKILECRVLPGRGCGYVQFSSWEAAEDAKAELEDRLVNGWPQKLTAKWAEPKGVSNGRKNYSEDEPPWSESLTSRAPRSGSDRNANSKGSDEVDYCRLFVGQLDRRGCFEDRIQDLFKPFGSIKECRVLTDKAVAYVTFDDEDAAAAAIKELNGADVSGLSRADGLNIQYSKIKRQ